MRKERRKIKEWNLARILRTILIFERNWYWSLKLKQTRRVNEYARDDRSNITSGCAWFGKVMCSRTAQRDDEISANMAHPWIALNRLETSLYSTLVDSGCKDVVWNSSARDWAPLSVCVSPSFVSICPQPASFLSHSLLRSSSPSLSLSLFLLPLSSLFQVLSLSSRASKQCLVYTAVARYFML